MIGCSCPVIPRVQEKINLLTGWNNSSRMALTAQRQIIGLQLFVKLQSLKCCYCDPRGASSSKCLLSQLRESILEHRSLRFKGAAQSCDRGVVTSRGKQSTPAAVGDTSLHAWLQTCCSKVGQRLFFGKKVNLNRLGNSGNMPGMPGKYLGFSTSPCPSPLPPVHLTHNTHTGRRERSAGAIAA